MSPRHDLRLVGDNISTPLGNAITSNPLEPKWQGHFPKIPLTDGSLDPRVVSKFLEFYKNAAARWELLYNKYSKSAEGRKASYDMAEVINTFKTIVVELERIQKLIK
jgi:hypothetical protein